MDSGKDYGEKIRSGDKTGLKEIHEKLVSPFLKEEEFLPPRVEKIYEKYTADFEAFLVEVKSKPEQAIQRVLKSEKLESLNQEVGDWCDGNDSDKAVCVFNYIWVGQGFAQAFT